MDEQENGMCCAEGAGCLPACAPLANPFVPFQPENAAIYETPTALIRGTLFPGLDLPFMGMVNTNLKDSPLGELMALGFGVTELGLYLDTHQNDTEAAELFKEYAKLYQLASEAYAETYGPLRQSDAVADGQYRWLNDPWPWDYAGGAK